MLRLAFSICLIGVATFAFLFASTPPLPLLQPIQFSHKLHLDYFVDRGPDGHRASMVSMHRKAILKELEDEEVVGEMMGMVEGGNCTLCHGDFDENVGDFAKLLRCAECHRYFLDHDWEGREEIRPCMGCHHSAVGSPRLAIPSTRACAACHSPPLGDGPEEAKLLEFIEQESEIPWEPVYNYMPSEVVFSHEWHVELGHVPCWECHGHVEQAERPLALEVKLSMEDCMGCHDASGAENDCLACHR